MIGQDCDARGYAGGRVVELTVSDVTDELQPSDGVALWWAPLDTASFAEPDVAACLSPEERQRADRFHRALDRRRFLAARGWLRHLLASQLGCAPGEIRLITGDRGKPSLVDSELWFSVARTASTALYATSLTMDVGVDVEAIRATVDVKGMAAKFMSPAEQRALAALPLEERLTASFRCWTRKEAFVKGIGAGLGFPLCEVDVWNGDRCPTTVSGWSVHDVDLAPGLAAAVAGASLDDWVPEAPRRLGS